MANTAATPPTAGSVLVATAGARNESLRSYTFHMDVAMAMSHFPWLHFHMEGIGQYDRGKRYLVHFTKMPFFASKIHDIDLSMIDPSMWPKHYRYREIGQQDGDTVFTLEDANDRLLKAAAVALNPYTGAHWLDTTYVDGTHIHMILNSNELNGFLLPATMTVQVDYPHMPLHADADFNNYSFAPAVR